MGRVLPFAAVAASLIIGMSATASQAVPNFMPSIPGLESSITNRISIGVSRGRLSPGQANFLQGRLNRLEQRQQMLISQGRLNGFERSRLASDLEQLNSELRFDESTRTFTGRRLWPSF